MAKIGEKWPEMAAIWRNLAGIWPKYGAEYVVHLWIVSSNGRVFSTLGEGTGNDVLGR